MSAPNTCSAPLQYFSCDSSNGGFKGCCGSNACFYGGCPDNELCTLQSDTPCGNICCNGTTQCIAVGICNGTANTPGLDEPITTIIGLVQATDAAARTSQFPSTTETVVVLQPLTAKGNIHTTGGNVAATESPASASSSSSKSFVQTTSAFIASSIPTQV